MKRLRLVDYFVCLFCFLSRNCRVIIHNFITFLPMFFIYFHFNTILHFILKFKLFFTTRFISNLSLQLPVSRMSSYHLSWVFSWWHSLAVALNFAENRPQGAWRRSILCDIPVFIFIFIFM